MSSAREDGHAVRRGRVWALASEGLSQRAIANQLRMGRTQVQRDLDTVERKRAAARRLAESDPAFVINSVIFEATQAYGAWKIDGHREEGEAFERWRAAEVACDQAEPGLGFPGERQRLRP